jgi:hypothetical protein
VLHCSHLLLWCNRFDFSGNGDSEGEFRYGQYRSAMSVQVSNVVAGETSDQ